MAVRVLVVDRQPTFSRGLGMLLPSFTAERVQVVASTDSGHAAAGLVRRHRPDVVLVDLQIGAPGGVRVIAAIRRTEPRVPVVAMAGAGDPCDVGAAVRAGACGVLGKAAEPEELLTPLLAAAAGWAAVPAGELRRLADHAPGAESPVAELTDGERQLWAMVASGLSTHAIGVRLHVSDRTVKRLTAALLRRLRVATRVEAARLAGRVGLD